MVRRRRGVSRLTDEQPDDDEQDERPALEPSTLHSDSVAADACARNRQPDRSKATCSPRAVRRRLRKAA